jgi:hypothetical protein
LFEWAGYSFQRNQIVLLVYAINMEYRRDMRWTNRILALLGAALVGGTVEAVPAGELKENYQSIIERNAFGLKPPPPPPADKPLEKEKPKTEIFLTGITSIGFPRLPKQAYFYTREQGKKDLTYYALTEGDSKDGIKILSIDPQQRKVRVNMNNSDTTLSFETHGVQVTAVPGKPGVPGLPVPGQPGNLQPQPGVQPLPMPTAPNTGRAMYDANGQPVYQNTGQPAANTGFQTAANPQLRQIPSRRIRGGPAASQPNDMNLNPGADPGAQPQMQQPQDPAEQYLRMHLNRAAQERDQGVPMPPLPTFE